MNENAETLSFDDIDMDYVTLAEFHDLKMDKPEASIFFDKDGKITGIDPIALLISCPPPQRNMKQKPYITVNYDCVDYDTSVTLDDLSDGMFEAEEIDGGYMVSTEDLSALSKVVDAKFTRDIVWPYDNASVHGSVERELNARPFDEKVAWYAKEGIAKTDAYKALEKESQADMTAAQKVRQVRKGRTTNEMLRDALKSVQGVVKVESIPKTTGKYAVQYRVRTSAGKIYDIFCNNAGTDFVVKNFGEFGNSVNTGSYEQVVRVIKQRINAEIERIKTSKMSARDKFFYNRAKLTGKDDAEVLGKDDDWGSDMDSAEEDALGIKEESFRSYLANETRRNRLYEAMKLMRINGYRVLGEAGSFKEFCSADKELQDARTALENAKAEVDDKRAEVEEIFGYLEAAMADGDEDIAVEFRADLKVAEKEVKKAKAAVLEAEDAYNQVLARVRRDYDAQK